MLSHLARRILGPAFILMVVAGWIERQHRHGSSRSLYAEV
jgi:hypothetical protein